MPLKRVEQLNQSLKQRRENEGINEDSIPSIKRGRPSRLRKGAKWDLADIMIKPTQEQIFRIRHHLFPALNACQLPLDDLSELQDFPNITVSMPIPVCVARKHCDHVDVCHRRTLARERYVNRLLTAFTCSKRAIQKNKKLRALQKQDIYSASIFDLAERLESNPDPYFNCSYDYYYTGGNLCVLPSRYIVHADGDSLKDLNVSRFSSKKKITMAPLRNLYRETMGQSSEILQVVPFHSQRNSQIDHFATRERNRVTLYSLSEEGIPKGITQFNNRTTPFISFTQSVGDLNKFVLTNMKQHVRLFDLNSSKALLSKVFEVGDINWNAVKAWREHTYLYANSKELYLLDVRTSPAEWRKSTCTFGPNEFFCENIVSLALSNFKNQFYVGSSHKLYSLDVRCWGSHFEGPATVCRWVHQLKYPPLLLETFRSDNSEYVALSSAVAEDWRICELTRAGKVADYPEKKARLDEFRCKQKYVYKSLSLPFQPTTLTEAYEAARLHGRCLRPDADLKKRLNCCTTGLAFYENYENKYAQTLLLSSNSNGDVFAHQLGVRESQEHEPRTSAFTDEVMCKFEETICRLQQRPLNYTEIRCMKDMGKVFRCSKLNPEKTALEVDDKDDKDETRKISRRFGRWQKSVHELHSYKDVLVQNILSVWDIDYEEEMNINLSQLNKSENVKPDPNSLVTNWLNKNGDAPPPMTSIAKDILTESFGKSFVETAEEAPHSTQLMDDSAVQEQLDMLLDTELENNQSLGITAQTTSTLCNTQTSTIKRKRKSYIEGF